MMCALDVAYDESSGKARAACVLFRDWSSAGPERIETADLVAGAPYEPGQFWRRELPCLLEVLVRLAEPPRLVIVDGYVWLDAAAARPGLGARLFAALDHRIPIVGVAKTPFAGDTWSARVLRGSSRRPLHVTSAGIDLAEAAAGIRAMHGAGRIPDLLRAVDRAARG
jgi:deoxyribonuclease V